MVDGSLNLTVPRGEKSVWDEPGFATRLGEYDRERWIAAAWGTGLALLGVRRGGFAGGLLAVLGGTLAVRAAVGRRDVGMIRGWADRTLKARGWRYRDIVEDASAESFPASDSPSWTATTATTNR